MPMPTPNSAVNVVDDERLGDGSRDTPRQICGIIEGVDLGHDDRKLVASNSGKN